MQQLVFHTVEYSFCGVRYILPYTVNPKPYILFVRYGASSVAWLSSVQPAVTPKTEPRKVRV